MSTYWAIKGKDGELKYYRDYSTGKRGKVTTPCLCRTKTEALGKIDRVESWHGSKPVKVTITEVE